MSNSVDSSFLPSECFLLPVEELFLIFSLNDAITESSRYSLSAPRVSSVWMDLFISPSQSGSSALCSHRFVRLQGQLNVACPLRLLLGINLSGAHKGQRSVWWRGGATSNCSDVGATQKKSCWHTITVSVVWMLIKHSLVCVANLAWLIARPCAILAVAGGHTPTSPAAISSH